MVCFVLFVVVTGIKEHRTLNPGPREHARQALYDLAASLAEILKQGIALCPRLAILLHQPPKYGD
jgi:hypothetical protein